MPDRIRASLISLVTVAATLLAAAPQPAAAATQKVAVIVGPTGSLTDSFRNHADDVAAAARSAGAIVTTVYSPNATWNNVKAAVEGANIIVWMGHGNGYPNPYTNPPDSLDAYEPTDRDNGWGLNRTTKNGDDDNWSRTMVYCGERALLGQLTSKDDSDRLTYCGGTANDGINPAPGFVMIYAHVCYAPGASEPQAADPTEEIAAARVANFSYPMLKLGAAAYYATDYSDEDDLVRRLLTQPATSYGDLFKAGRAYSSSALRAYAHPDVADTTIWIQKTSLGYAYAFAGNPNASQADPNAAPPPPPASVVTRFGGADRYAVAAGLSAASFEPGVSVAYVATGTNFPDALAGGVLAGRDGGPMLLVTPTAIPSVTATELQRLQPGRIVVLGGPGSVGDDVLDALKSYTSGSVSRIWGPDRYAVAAEVSKSAFDPGVPVAYIATGTTFPDALAGVGPAAIQGGPILLVRGGVMPSVTATELRRLEPQRIVVLGGPGSVGAAVFDALDSYTDGSVTRLWGDDRYGAALDISRGSFDSADTIFVATGRNFPDALAGGPLAATTAGPLLLVPGTSLPDGFTTEVRRLGASKAVILGGPASVSTGVEAQLESLLGG